MMFPPRPTELLHLLLRPEISDGDFAIDATAGNGHDTCFLADAVGPSGRVLAIDIQQEAIESTRVRLEREGLLGRVELHLGSHSGIAEISGERVPSVIVFNLGYLPGGDHAVITRTGETLAAMEAAAEILRPGGILAVVCYPGHEGGDGEAVAVSKFLSSLAGYRTARYGMVGTEKSAPFLLMTRKPG